MTKKEILEPLGFSSCGGGLFFHNALNVSLDVSTVREDDLAQFAVIKMFDQVYNSGYARVQSDVRAVLGIGGE